MIKAVPLSPLFNEVLITLGDKMDSSKVYELTVNSVVDCAGNSIGMFNKAKVGIPKNAISEDILINELLFNPKPDGFDYVELYNGSKKIIEISRLFIASRNSSGTLTNIQKLSQVPFLLFPGEWIVLTENKKWVMDNYHVKEPDKILQITDLPTLPDDKGNLVLLNEQGIPIDELNYDEQWHFALISNKDGVALERINYTKATQDKTNWTSAASTTGFGTPTAMNSQYLLDPQLQGAITVTPKIFSPDNDGYDDIATISYQGNEPGYVINISIFDANGRLVRSLVKNSTVAQRDQFRWDGLNDRQQALPIGIYIIYTEVFNLKGKSARFKNTITLARKF